MFISSPLQDTYQKEGQMEKTMLTTFTTKSFMEVTIQHLSGMDGWKDSIAIREQLSRTERWGMYAHGLHAFMVLRWEPHR